MKWKNSVMCMVVVFGVSCSDKEAEPESCASTHALIGAAGSFEGPVGHPFFPRGNVVVVNDCTLEMTEFNWDGLGDETYVYAGIQGEMINDRLEILDGFQISEQINGNEIESADGALASDKEYVDATMTLALPEGRTLDEVEGVWIFDVSAEESMSWALLSQ